MGRISKQWLAGQAKAPVPVLRWSRGRKRTEHQENTKRIRRKYEGNTKDTPEPPASSWLAHGFFHAIPTLGYTEGRARKVRYSRRRVSRRNFLALFPQLLQVCIV